jgi:hypothetical protein
VVVSRSSCFIIEMIVSQRLELVALICRRRITWNGRRTVAVNWVPWVEALVGLLVHAWPILLRIKNLSKYTVRAVIRTDEPLAGLTHLHLSHLRIAKINSPSLWLPV